MLILQLRQFLTWLKQFVMLPKNQYVIIILWLDFGNVQKLLFRLFQLHIFGKILINKILE